MSMKILIIGGGQLGSRHLQACCLIEQSVEIYVCDPSQDALDICKIRAEQMNPHQGIKIYYISYLSDAAKDINVAIISTNSKVRASVTKELLSQIKPENIVFEKFLFPRMEEYDSTLKLLKENGVKAWVNCPRRMFEIYNNIKSEIDSDITMSISGSSWGMGSNSIHFIDLFSFLANDSDIRVEAKGLSDELLSSKRSGYIELSGQLNVMSNHSKCKITCEEGDIILPTIQIDTDKTTYYINESKKELVKKDKTSDKEEKTSFTIPFQSGLSNLFVEDIIEKNTCQLTPFEESANLHKALLGELLDRYKKGETASFEIT